MLFHRGAAEDVLLEDTFDDFLGGGVIPDAIGVDQGDGAMLADAEAVGFGAEDALRALHEVEFGESFFEVVPTGDACLFVAAFWLGLVGAEEDVPADATDAEVGGYLREALFVVGSHRN